MDQATQLQQLKQQLQNDQSLPLRQGATQLVFGEGNPNADIYLLGEAPGYHEDQQGRPFVGHAGKLLDQLITEIGLKRADVYISNVVRFRPPANRDPEAVEINAFAPYVDQEIAIVNPKMIVTLGRFSMAKFIPNSKISQIHGQARLLEWNGKTIVVMPMYHPAAALRADAVLQQLKADFKKIPRLLARYDEKFNLDKDHKVALSEKTEIVEETNADHSPDQEQLKIV